MIDYFNPFAKLVPPGTSGNIGSEVKYKRVDLTDTIPEGPGGREVLIAPLVEDLTLNIETSFKKPASLLPSSFQRITELMGLLKTSSGATSRSPNILDVLDVPIWESTEPAKFDVKLQFFLDTNAYNDVVRPAIGLVALSMLSPRDLTQVEQTSFLLPGINFSNLGKVLKGLDTKKTRSEQKTKTLELEWQSPEMAKIVSVEIPGVLYLPAAIIEKASITVSKDISESGFPIWSDVQLSITGLRSANTDMFVPGVNTGMPNSLIQASKQYQESLQNDGFFQSGERAGAI